MVRSPDTERAAEILDGSVERIEGDTLFAVAADPAAINLRLIAAGVRVSEFAPERRSLEDLVLSVTGTGSDRVDRSDDRPGQSADPDGDAGQAAGGDPK